MEKLRPSVCVLKAAGTNCDNETRDAFELAGANPTIVHTSELKKREADLRKFQILAIPGGFSYGDAIASGRILASELIHFLADQTNDFINHGGLIIGICNGFQVLVRTGLLPFNKITTEVKSLDATLDTNESGHFEWRWINLRVEKGSRCPFLESLEQMVTYQVAHGEGRFLVDPLNDEVSLNRIENDGLVAFRYANQRGEVASDYPENPNGSLNAIAGISDPTGRILGLMPHPERYIRHWQHPNWRRMPRDLKPQGLPLFEGMVRFASQS